MRKIENRTRVPTVYPLVLILYGGLAGPYCLPPLYADIPAPTTGWGLEIAAYAPISGAAAFSMPRGGAAPGPALGGLYR